MKNKSPIFTFILPVYNSENFLCRAIKSVLNQSYHNWELIIINDGSTDNSEQIIEEIKKNDSRIKYIYQENSGAGAARNIGLKYSKGDFVAFLDSDDFIDTDYLYELLPFINDYDLIFIDNFQVDEKGNCLKKELLSKYKNYTKEQLIRIQMTGKMPWGGWRKIIRKDLITNNRIKYSDVLNGEEALFSFIVLLKAQNIKFFSDKPLYYYTVRNDSLSKIKISDPWGGAADLIKDYLISNNLYNKYANTLNAFYYTATLVSMDRIVSIYGIRNSKNYLLNRYNEYLKQTDSSYGIDFHNMILKAKLIKPIFDLKLFKVIILICHLKK